MERRGVYVNLVVSALLLGHAGLLAWSARCHGPVVNEFGHLAAGVSHLHLRSFDLFRVNPPLVRTVAALPVVLARPKVDWHNCSSDPLVRSEYAVGRDFLRANGVRSLWLLALGRWACIPFCLLGAWVCLRWATDLYGVAAGLLAMSLWCFSPSILGHGSLLTADVPAAAMGVLACYMFWRWLRVPDWLRAVAAGVALGLAELTKTTLVVLYPLWLLAWVLYRWRDRRPKAPRYWPREASMLFSQIALGVYLTNVGYGFEGSLQRLEDYHFQSRWLSTGSPYDMRYAAANRFRDTWLRFLPVPLPRNYVQGIDTQKFDCERQRWSYMGGEWRQGGSWYYYLYGLAIKIPLGTWMLAFVAAFGSLLGRGYSASWRDELVLLLPVGVVLVLVSSQTGLNDHLRYAWPVLPFAIVWTSKVARTFTLGHRRLAVVVAGGLVWSVGSSLYHYPHSLSYFNEMAGGPKRGHEHLLSSNMDWGQDLLFLKQWLNAHPDLQPIGLAYSVRKDLFDPADVGIKYTVPPSGPDALGSGSGAATHESGPLPGWYAIFVGAMRERERRYAYFEQFKPVEMLGYTVRIYHVSAEDADRVRRKFGLPEIGTGVGSGTRKTATSKS